MSLRTKLLLSMLLLALVPLLLFGITAYLASTSSLISIERDNLANALDTVVQRAMPNLQESIERPTQDYSNWDPLWDIVSTDGPPDAQFIKDNFDPESISSAPSTFDLQLVSFWSKDLALKHNLGSTDEVKARLTELGAGLLDQEHPTTDYLDVGGNLYIVSFKAIRKSDATDPNGYLVFGHKLGDVDIQQIKALTGFDVALYKDESPVASAGEASGVTPAPEALKNAAAGKQVLDQSNANIALAYGPIVDRTNRPVGTIVVWRPRTSAMAAQNSISTTLAIAFIFGGILAAIVALLVQRSITRPLHAMVDTADKIAAGDFEQRVAAPSKDELGRLATAFNQMTAKVSERFSESTTENIRLQHMNEYRLNLLSAITQELQAPINHIKDYTESLSMSMYGTLNEAQRRLVNAINRSVALEEALVSDLVDFSSAQQKQLRISRERIVLEQVVRDTAQNVRQRYTSKSIQFTPSIPNDLPPVFADHVRLTQIIEQLLSWCYDMTVPNGRVVLSAIPIQGMVRVSISDTSKGLTSEEANRLFDLFYRPSTDTPNKSNGTEPDQPSSFSGLGLAMVRALIEQHGGTIDLSVRPGEGNTFIFTLPSTN